MKLYGNVQYCYIIVILKNQKNLCLKVVNTQVDVIRVPYAYLMYEFYSWAIAFIWIFKNHKLGKLCFKIFSTILLLDKY